MDDAGAQQLLESLDRHFLAGCPSLSASQLREHEATGTCPECRRRATALSERELDQVLATAHEEVLQHVRRSTDPGSAPGHG